MLAVAGCATVLTGNNQSVTLEVTCRGISHPSYCVARNAKGSWGVYTPQTSVVETDLSPLEIACESSVGNFGLIVYPNPNITSAGNIIAGGLIGGAIDLSTASAWRYPRTITIESPLCAKSKK